MSIGMGIGSGFVALSFLMCSRAAGLPAVPLSRLIVPPVAAGLVAFARLFGWPSTDSDQHVPSSSAKDGASVTRARVVWSPIFAGGKLRAATSVDGSLCTGIGAAGHGCFNFDLKKPES